MTLQIDYETDRQIGIEYEELAKQYVPSYKFSSWRQINKTYPIELFKNHWMNGREGEFYVLVDNSSSDRHIVELDLTNIMSKASK